jgi:NhaA family Na+:H+ antiporter
MRRLLTPFMRFARSESFAGLLLMVFALLAFIWANSPWSAAYFAMKEVPLSISLGEVWKLGKPLELWVNDALMAVFFLLVGLEIKRELVIGELNNPRRASLAIFAALGGMIVPALIYTGFNLGSSGARGWGIPMATDIAFALGILALLGSRVPLSLKVFLTALAIVDDLGAVLVIALFYTANLNLDALLAAGVCLALAALAGWRGVRSLYVYSLLGVLLWYFVLKSGVHATVAGVLLALTVPIGSRVRHEDEITPQDEPTAAMVEHESPLHRLEHALQPPVTFVILPIFALFNAGVAVSGSGDGSLSLVTLGVFFGLLIGKPIGITLFSWVAVRLGLASLPNGTSWRAVFGIGMLGGIGFTMALFIANLAFPASALLDQAKIGVLSGSVVSALLGVAWLMFTTQKPVLHPQTDFVSGQEQS